MHNIYITLHENFSGHFEDLKSVVFPVDNGKLCTQRCTDGRAEQVHKLFIAYDRR
jgi:hypothetical protein